MAAPIYVPTNSAQGFTFLHILPNLLFVVFLIITIPTVVRRYFTVVFIFISLVISDVQHLFMCLLISARHLWQNVYSGLLSTFFFIELFVFLILSCMNCLYNLDINPLSHLLQIFSPLCCLSLC